MIVWRPPCQKGSFLLAIHEVLLFRFMSGGNDPFTFIGLHILRWAVGSYIYVYDYKRIPNNAADNTVMSASAALFSMLHKTVSA